MGSLLRIFVFQIGVEYFGIEADRLRGIVDAAKAIKVINVHSSQMDGMLSLEDGMIPILNLHEKLQIEPLNAQYYLICTWDNKTFAFLIDKLDRRYYDVPLEQLKSVRQILQGKKQQYFRWIAHLGSKLVFIF